MRRALLLLAGVISISALSGCGEISLGPRAVDHHVFIRTTTKKERNIELCRCAESRTVETEFRSEDDKISVDKLDLKDCVLVRPDVAHAEGLIAPRIAENVTVKIIREDGKPDRLDVGGWYVKG